MSVKLGLFFGHIIWLLFNLHFILGSYPFPSQSIVIVRMHCVHLLEILLLFIHNPCIVDCRKKLAKNVTSSVTVTEVMSTFTVSRDVSLLFKVTWRVYLWLHPHYPCLHLLFDLLSSVYIQYLRIVSLKNMILMSVILPATTLNIVLILFWIYFLFHVHKKSVH